MTQILEGIKVENGDKPSIKLIRGQKGSYGWEIKAYGDDLKALVEIIQETDKALKSAFMSV